MGVRLVSLLTFVCLVLGVQSNSDDPNLASYKTVTQSDIFGDDITLYGPTQAANGGIQNSTFAKTKEGINKWWMVDLGQSYEVTNVELYNIDGGGSSDLQKVYILTSQEFSPPDPDLTSDSWTIRYYHDPPYGALGNIILEEGVPAQHVAVFSSHDKGVTLAEVKVYSYRDLAYKCQAYQHQLYGGYYAKKAVDGILYGSYHFSHTYMIDSWWKVDLEEVKTVALVDLYSRTDEFWTAAKPGYFC